MDERDFRSRLAKEQIDLVLRRNGTGRIYGVTFIDHRSRTVLNGLTSGQGVFGEHAGQMLSGAATRSPAATSAVRSVRCGSGTGRKFWEGVLSGMEPELNYVPRIPGY